MKQYLVILFFLPLFVHGQTCDTLFSHEKYIERKIEIEYRDCHFFKIDTVYTVVQWSNIDTNYLEQHYSENICYSLYHSVTNTIIRERWQQDDTVFLKSYYSSGNLKTYSKHFLRKDPYYFHDQIQEYFENGNIRYEGEYKSLSFSTHNTYYPNGKLESSAKRFSHNPHAFGDYTEYFPNGQASMILTYFEPDTTTNKYQTNTLFMEKYFDMTGEEVNKNLNEYKKMYIPIYPPKSNDPFFFSEDENIYTHQQFHDQKAYSNDVRELRNAIASNLKLPKKESCNQGVVWLAMIVSKKGILKIEEVEFGNEALRKRVKKSIRKIRRWPAALVNDKKVDTYVYTYLLVSN